MKETTTKDLRQFGIVLGLILGIIGGIHYLKGNYNVYPWFFTFGAAALLFGALLPAALRIPFKVFTKVAHAIGWFNTRVILVIIYYLLLTPIGLVMRLFGKDILNLKIEKEKESYWLPRAHVTAPKESLEKQF